MSGTTPEVLLGWAGTRYAGSGVWILEHPTNEQLQVFSDVGFPYVQQALFADPELMRQAGATFYTNAKEQPAVRNFVNSTIDPNHNPPIMFGFKRGEGPKGYIIRKPTDEQIQVFKDADYDFRRAALAADSDLMERAGAERCANLNLVPEFVAIILGGSLNVRCFLF